MEALVDASSRSQMSALPSIGFLDSDKMKRDGDRHQNGTASAMVSPPFQFASRPSLYSHNSNSSGLISPPESRRTSGEEQATIPPARQSLPSIHEALGRDTPLNYPGPPPPPPNSLPTPTSSYFSNSAPTSASDPSRKRPFSATTPPPPPPPSFSQPTQRSPYMGHPPPGPSQSAPTQQPPHSRPEPLTAAPMYSQGPKIPSLHVRTGKSPPTNPGRPSISYSSQSPASYQHSPQSAPPNASFGYSNHQSQYAYQSASSSGQGYPAPAVLSAPPRYPQPPVWGDADIRAEEMKRAGKAFIPAYGENVKRHLEQFDFEASLNSMAECSSRVMDFARTCGQRAHQAHRSGSSPSSMPTMKELEELNPMMRRLQESFSHLQEVVATAAMAEQHRDPALGSNGYGSDHKSYLDDGKIGGGFAGPDPKKRRGRAAPPGRCHSCNRAETPEWRRGPDGARTLCNACGLHYAKLARKMGTTSKAGIQNSSLRPKSLGPVSPTS